MKTVLNGLLAKIGINLGREFYRFLEFDRLISIESFINKNLFRNPRYHDIKRLNKYEYQVFSQNGEDGIIFEIFKRIGLTNDFFVEFGVENGLQNNTSYLLLNNWCGLWIEGNSVNLIKKKFSKFTSQNRLIIKQAFITKDNIEALFQEANIPYEFDLLSIDIDGNDYWIWKSIVNYFPRVVVIEYNASLGPHIEWVMKYDTDYVWDKTSYFGASLKSLELLGAEKGYKLVGCNFTGVNSFFVREDLVGDKFLSPFTSGNHYEPPRYFLYRESGHIRSYKIFE